MIDSNFYKEKASIQHKQAAMYYIDSLFKGGVDDFWNMLSEADQMLIYENHKVNRQDVSFKEYLASIREEECSKFMPISYGNYGSTDTVRYTPNGTALIYLLPDVKKDVHFIAPDITKIYLVMLVMDLKYDPKAHVFNWRWKVRLKGDEFKTALNHTFSDSYQQIRMT